VTPYLCCIDLETSGLSPHKGAEILEIGACLVSTEDLSVVAQFQTLVKPEGPLDPIALEVNGITELELTHAPSLSKAKGMFLQFSQHSIPVAHNAPFEAAFFEHYEVMGATDWLDTLVGVQKVGKYWSGKGRYKLGSVVERFDIEWQGPSHRALPDALALASVVKKLAEDYQWRPWLDPQWPAKQADARKAYQSQLAAYKAKQKAALKEAV
jgi:DNA polymerase III subunit epsilon